MYTRLNEILSYVPEDIRKILENTFRIAGDSILEIRFRIGRPLIVSLLSGNFAVLPSGTLSPAVGGAYIVKSSDIRGIFQLICENSVYAYSDEIKQGFITVRGGHRVGFTGRAVCDKGKIINIKDISSVNFRVAREVIGAANEIADRIISQNGIKSTLLVSPPMGGKTTVIRDLARQISNRGFKVGIIDDRGEIAAMYKGIPQNDIGLQTDVVENAPKLESVIMLLRSMSPQVVITDEISCEEDARAVKQCFGTGVGVIGSAHGITADEIMQKKFLSELIGKGGFETVAVLSPEGTGMNKYISFAFSDFSSHNRI